MIGTVLIPGASAPKLVTTEMVASMHSGGVVIDIAIDQGGCFETTDHISTHDDPTYTKHGIIHYAVANMPGAVPRTSTIALSNATLSYAKRLAKQGYRQASPTDSALMMGINTLQGQVTHQAVANALGHEFVSADRLLSVND